MKFEIAKECYFFRLTAPYSEERREAAWRCDRENNAADRRKESGFVQQFVLYFRQTTGRKIRTVYALLTDHYTSQKEGGTKMPNHLLLNPEEFEIDDEVDEMNEDGWEGAIYCKRLIEKWTPQLETEMLEAFIRLYYDEMYNQWGPDDEERSKEYWPEIQSPEDLVKYTGTDVRIYALKNAVYARSKTGKAPYESQNVPACVILVLDCPWDEEHGWAAVFIDERFVKVDRDIVDCVWLD